MTVDQDLVMSRINGAFDPKDPAPSFDFNQVGRIRLVNALSRRFGAQFRNNAGASDALKAFDEEASFVGELRKLRGK